MTQDDHRPAVPIEGLVTRRVEPPASVDRHSGRDRS